MVASPCRPQRATVPASKTQHGSERRAALAFVDGVRTGWAVCDLLAWVDEHLIRTSRLATTTKEPRIVAEAGLGAVRLNVQPAVRLELHRELPASQIPRILSVAHDRVIEALRQRVIKGQASFLHAALYSGRVTREKNESNQAGWVVRLVDEDSLSDQVLALFAADALRDPDGYEQALCVCEACSAVEFRVSSAIARTGCSKHPAGCVDAKSRAVTKR